jgi:hypothetical protein
MPFGLLWTIALLFISLGGSPLFAQTAQPTQPPKESQRFTFEAQQAGKLTPATSPSLLKAQPERRPVTVKCPNGACIVQFHRLLSYQPPPPPPLLRGDASVPSNKPGNKPIPCCGALGSFENDKIQWLRLTPMMDFSAQLTDAIKSINGSKVFISGSVVIHQNVESCAIQSWYVVTQTVDSSNNLVYLPSDVTAFCTEGKTLLIVLPVHAIWASVYGVPPSDSRLNDPTWRITQQPPKGRNCGGTDESDKLPLQLIRNCSLGSGWLMRSFAAEYNRVTLPGVSQGSISITPWATATKATWDVQAYESTRLGRGWLGGQFMYEHDRKLPDDFNSFTPAVTYDLRIQTARGRPRDQPKNPFWFNWGASKATEKDKHDNDKSCTSEANSECGPPLLGIRPLEFIGRFGAEWSPSAENTAKTTQGTYMPKDLNLVLGATWRLPIIFSPIGPNKTKQPSQFTIVPVFGLEGGFRKDSHPICALEGPVELNAPQCVPALATPSTPATSSTPAPCPPHASIVTTNPDTCTQPFGIFRKVAGMDASARWPYNWTRRFLGDRPITLDFSYRARWLSYAEPFYDATYAEKNPLQAKQQALPEVQSKGTRYYMRSTLIIPVSAYFQFRASWQRGELPPLFQFVGSQMALGLAFSNPGSSEH